MMSCEEGLTQALALLERGGWTKGALVNDDGERCAIGALSSVNANTPEVRNVLCEVNNIPFESFDYGCGFPSSLRNWNTIVEWNNDEHTTFEDIVLAFKRAIIYAHENGL